MVKQRNKFGGKENPDSRLEKESMAQFPLVKRNFSMMTIAGVLILVGFLLMLGGSSTEDAFNPDIFSTRRVVLGPAISFLGYIFMGYAIIRRFPKKNQHNQNAE